MPAKSINKNKDSFKEMEKQITPIFVMNNSALKPYIELFEYHPENIYQQPLGSLVGFFEIKDYSEDSAYIVNFLTSVLKKEYYMNPKRPVAESFDSALHKVNVALSEIVKHGNVNWLGKLDAVICVLEKNSIHFSVTGSGHLFINRAGVLTDISEGLAPQASDEPHPLKTFLDVSSGRIEEKDKILIFSDDMFQVLPSAQLKKSVQRFEKENFIQFLKTALTNELEMTATIIIDFLAPEKKAPKKIIATEPVIENEFDEEFNAFSGKTYEKTGAKIAKKIVIEEPVQEKEKEEYTDKKTGHIYIQGEDQPQIETTQFQLFMSMAKENIADFIFQAKTDLKRKTSLAIKNLKKTKKTIPQNESIEETEQIIEPEEIEIEQPIETKDETIEAPIESVKHLTVEEVIETQPEIMEEKISEEPEEIIEEEQEPVIEVEKIKPLSEDVPAAPLTLQEKIARARMEMDARFDKAMDARSNKDIKATKQTEIETVEEIPEDTETETKESPFKQKLETIGLSLKNSFEQIKASVQKPVEHHDAKAQIEITEKISQKIVPDFSKIKNLFEKFSTKQKIGALVAILLIFVVPLIYTKLTTPKPAPIIEAPAAQPSLKDRLTQEKNINLETQIQSLFSATDLVSVIFYNNQPYAIGKQTITTINNGERKEFPLPDNSGNPIYGAFMGDLNLVFILTDQKKIISFSPISEQFKDNAIEFPANSDPKFIATYLTYLYTPDPANNQIYRYPRADGGFGAKTDWLKESTPLGKITAMAIDDNVYLVSENKISKFFKGKLEQTTFENSQTQAYFDYIYTSTENSFLYALDANNGRIIQYTKEGQINKQFFNEDLVNAKSFTVDNQDKTAYVVTSMGLVSVPLQ